MSAAPIIDFNQSTVVEPDEHATLDNTAELLNECERAIDAGYNLMRYGLSTIVNNELWRSKGYATLDDYLAQEWGDKWGFKRRNQIKHAYGLIAALNAIGLIVEDFTENQIREIRRLLKVLSGARTGEAAALVLIDILGGEVSRATAKALIVVLQEYLASGGVQLQNDTVLLREATAVQAGKLVAESKALRLAKWVQLDDLIEQLDLGTNKQYTIQRCEDGFSGDFPYVPIFVQPDQLTMYDALRVTLDALYTAYDPQYYTLEV